MNRLQNKVAVITGGASGFGFAIAEVFAREGAAVVIVGRNKEKGAGAAEKIRKITGMDSRFIQCDVTKEDEVKHLAETVIGSYKKIDILVNSAGILIRKDFEETTEKEWDEVMATNLKGPFFCCKHMIPFMVEKKMGSVINISSHISLIGKGDVPVYSASKGGVTALTRSLALRYAKHNIRVNCICPGTILTEMNRHVFEKAPDPEKKLREVIATYPLGRLGTPMDVAYAAVYLGSDESSWVTGVALPVEGGYTAGKE
jgi:meso-butanediol dehydrogenase / (S,S)-butanediol dehydrogenase / diacetyl reductase